jgi:hypothetical protein
MFCLSACAWIELANAGEIKKMEKGASAGKFCPRLTESSMTKRRIMVHASYVFYARSFFWACNRGISL